MSFSSKYLSTKNQDRIDLKIAMSPDYRNLSIVPLITQFPNLAKESDVENLSKERKYLPFCSDLKKYTDSDPVLFSCKVVERYDSLQIKSLRSLKKLKG